MRNLIKKTLTLSLLLTLTVGLFVACSSSDDDTPSGGVAGRVAGTYVGNLKTLSFNDTTEVLVTAAGDSEVLITFAPVIGIEPFKVKLTDAGDGIIQSNIDPICAFYTKTNQVILASSIKLFSFSGDKK